MLRCVKFFALICLVASSDYRKCGFMNSRRTMLRCSKNDLRAVPQNLPPGVTSLTIKNDDLSEGFEFPSHKRLKKLYLVNVFIGREIPARAFAKLKNLHDLRIQYLPKAADNLTIHSEAFHGLKKLVTVRLINLGLSQLPDNMFKDSPKLKHIYITGNSIERVGRNVFTPLVRVQQLNLMHNQISTIEEGAFICVDETFRDPRIYLSNNELTEVPTEIVHEKIKLKIHDNPIVCDCSLKIPRAFRDKEATCGAPPDLRGAALTTLAGKTIDCVCYPPEIDHGITAPSSPIPPGEKLEIRCSEGYSLTSMPSLVCQEDGTFGDIVIPHCIEDRIEPEELEDGSLLLVSNAFSVYPDFITLDCPTDTVLKSCKCTEFYCQGVILEDTSCRIYAAPNNATKGEIICIPNDLVLEHYTHSSTDDIEHFAACKPFYQMTVCSNYNPMRRVAENHGVLVPDASDICRVDCDNTDCDMYIRCLIIVEKKKCDKFSIYMGTVTMDGVEMTTSTTFEEGDVVTIRCNEGYELFLFDEGEVTEEATLTCVEGETYYPSEIPECFEIIPTCELTPIEDVVAFPALTVEEGMSVTLSCRAGFEGEQEEISCQSDGTFSAEPQISCQKKALAECYVEAVSHATINIQGGGRLEGFTVVEGTVVIVNCESGYRPSTYRDRLTCLRNGQLSDDMPTCIEADDPKDEKCSVPRLQNGYPEDYTPGEEIERGTVITFQCNEGYRFHDPSSVSLTCISNQYFEPNRLPRCKRQEVRCEVPELENGYYSGYRAGESILLTEVLWPVCDYGYDLFGPEPLKCSAANFGGDVNTCVRPTVDCVIPMINNGHVRNEGQDFKEGSKFPIVCDRGYYNTYTYINCVVGPSTYDPYSVPDCLRPEWGCPKVGFPLMKPLLEEPRRGDTVEVECIEGYTLVGESTLTCGQKFDYTARKLPECVPIAGCEIPIIENGETNTTLTHLEDGEGVEIYCNEGYMIYGDAVISCEKGSWSGIVTPECRPEEEMEDDCYMPIVWDGSGEYWPLADGFLNPGSTLVLYCNEGFGVANDYDRVMCVTGSTFEPEELPECTELEITGCTTPNIRNGFTDPDFDIEVGETVYVTCDDGYELRGEEELECGADGSFGELPVCAELLVQCSVPEIDNALISPAYPISEGDMYLVACDRGYELIGDEELICGSDGETNTFFGNPDDYPECVYLPGPCAKPRITNGWLTYDQGEFEIPYREETFVVCNGPNYGPKQTLVTCMGNNQWEPPIPVCTWRGPTCEFPVIEHAMITPQLDEVLPEQTLTITCEEGYVKNPRADMTCVLTGDRAQYDIRPPVCEQTRSSCITPRISNGYITGPETLYTDDRFTVHCNEGYALVGQTGPLVCFKDIVYSDHLPSCQKVDTNVTACSKPFVQNAKILAIDDGSSEVLAGHYITVICEEGYSIEGQSRLQCLTTGQFDQPMPQCVAKPEGSELQCGERRVVETSSQGPGAGSLDDTDITVDPTWEPDPTVPLVEIHGGQDVDRGEYPWNVLIELSRGRFCGGSIVGKEWVLTAGHCLLSDFHQRCNNRGDNPCNMMSKVDVRGVIAGMHDRSSYQEEGRQVRTASDLVLHPFFTSQATYIDFDVGLIKVNEPFIYNESVNRVCLPKAGVGTLVGNKNLEISGWGKTNTSRDASIMQATTVPYVSREICNQDRSYGGVVTETMFCAGYQEGRRDACQGDSGGPLVYLGANGTYEQGGIISWGRYCAAENFYGVYTNLPYFYDWIMNYIGQN